MAVTRLEVRCIQDVDGAARRVRPYAVDVCSGLRDGEGRLVEEWLARFVDELGTADGTGRTANTRGRGRDLG